MLDNKRTRVITYWNTDVVRFSDDKIVLNSGGYRTATTKLRMNQASNQYGLGYYVAQIKGVWFVEYRGKQYVFIDEMEMLR